MQCWHFVPPAMEPMIFSPLLECGKPKRFRAPARSAPRLSIARLIVSSTFGSFGLSQNRAAVTPPDAAQGACRPRREPARIPPLRPAAARAATRPALPCDATCEAASGRPGSERSGCRRRHIMQFLRRAFIAGHGRESKLNRTIHRRRPSGPRRCRQYCSDRNRTSWAGSERGTADCMCQAGRS